MFWTLLFYSITTLEFSICEYKPHTITLGGRQRRPIDIWVIRLEVAVCSFTALYIVVFFIFISLLFVLCTPLDKVFREGSRSVPGHYIWFEMYQKSYDKVWPIDGSKVLMLGIGTNSSLCQDVR